VGKGGGGVERTQTLLASTLGKREGEKNRKRDYRHNNVIVVCGLMICLPKGGGKEEGGKSHGRILRAKRINNSFRGRRKEGGGKKNEWLESGSIRILHITLVSSFLRNKKKGKKRENETTAVAVYFAIPTGRKGGRGRGKRTILRSFVRPLTSIILKLPLIGGREEEGERGKAE